MFAEPLGDGGGKERKKHRHSFSFSKIILSGRARTHSYFLKSKYVRQGHVVHMAMNQYPHIVEITLMLSIRPIFWLGEVPSLKKLFLLV